ncbi:MAG: type II secretion system inner membrane protein GspF [Hyphomonadaceae bacterium]|nr:type II secretion system inner membrane protein GspF [Hyphomonadaceae bacterium]
MPRYSYVAIDEDGRQKRGGLEAANENAARAALQKRKLLPVQVAPSGAVPDAAATAAAPQRPLRGEALSHRALLIVTRQLATLIDAAVPVDEALAMISAQQDNAAARRIVADVHAGVLEGMRLADAMGRHPKSFSGLYRAAVAGGERSGKLGAVLQRLTDYLARAQALRSKITTAMIYPAALSAVALTVITCLMIFVVPSLTEQFQTFGAQLPLLTRILIGVSTFLVTFWPLLLLAAAAAIWLGAAALRRETVRTALDGAILRAPLIGKWAQAVNASRFVRAVSTLTASGLPMLDAVRAARESAPNRVVAAAIAVMASRIEEGESLSAAMRRSGVVPPMIAYMAASGENAGELPAMLEKAADQVDQEFEAFTTSALALLEPAVIIVMGVVVAGIVLAIMLPILQLNRLAIG